MHGNPRVGLQPRLDLGMFVGSVVVGHDVQLDPGVGLGDQFEEGQELRVGVPLVAGVGVVAGATSNAAKRLVVGLLLLGSLGPGGKVTEAILSVGSVALARSVVHTMFTTRYARLYYTGAQGGISFNEDDPPKYSDFAYLAFTIGMTYQVSDTDLLTKTLRATALRHALPSYLFGVVIIATMINLVAGLSKGALSDPVPPSVSRYVPEGQAAPSNPPPAAVGPRQRQRASQGPSSDTSQPARRLRR